MRMELQRAKKKWVMWIVINNEEINITFIYAPENSSQGEKKKEKKKNKNLSNSQSFLSEKRK